MVGPDNALLAILIGFVLPIGLIFCALVFGMYLGYRERRYWERRAQRPEDGEE